MTTKITRLVLVQTLVVMAMIAAATIYVPASAASNAPQTFPSSVNKALSAKWWNWAFSFNAQDSPLTDTTGARCDEGNQGKVFFLAGVAAPAGSTAERTCTVSHKQAILFPIINAACTIGDVCATNDPVTSINQLKKEVSGFVSQASGISATLDGQPISLKGARVQSPLFKTTLVEDNPFGAKAGTFTAFADGYWVLLKPLSIGQHTLNFKGEIGSFKLDVTYNLNVV
jgi:hypothetical protein